MLGIEPETAGQARGIEKEGIKMENPGSILEPACLYADQGDGDLTMLADIVLRYGCRNAIVHLADVEFLSQRISVDKIKAVIDFPNGKHSLWINREEMAELYRRGVRGADICMNLAQVLAGDLKSIRALFSRAHEIIDDGEIKAIVQLPFLWQYAREKIEPLVVTLAAAGVNVIKDWTTVHNFSKPIDVSVEKRLEYLDYLRQIITKNNLPLLIKIAGGVRNDNARLFVEHGADILGVSVQFVPDVVEALK